LSLNYQWVKQLKYLCLLVLLLLPTVGSTVELTEGDEPLYISELSQTFYDVNHEYASIKQLISGNVDFEQGKRKSLVLPEIKTWVKVTLSNQSETSKTNYLSLGFPSMQYLNASWYNKDGIENIIQLDAQSPYFARLFDAPLLYLPLTLNAGEVKTLYIHYLHMSNEPLKLVLYSPSAISVPLQQDAIINALCLGLLFTIFFMACTQGVVSKSLTQLYYAGLILAFSALIGEVSGYNLKFLWPEGGWIAEKAVAFIVVFIPLLHLSFIRQFLQLKSKHRKLNRAFLIFITLNTLILLLTPFFNLIVVSLVLGTMVIPILFYTVIWSFSQRVIAARAFAVSLFSHLILINILALAGSSIVVISLPFELPTLFKIAYTIEALFFAVAIALQHKAFQQAAVRRIQQQAMESQHIVTLENDMKLSSEKNKLIQKQALDKKQLLANLSHELRTPLTVMQIEIETLQQDFSNDVQASYGSIKNKIKDINHLIDDLTMLAKSEVGALTFDLKAIPINSTLNSLSSELGSYVTAEGFTWSSNITLESNLYIYADTAKIRQLLLNIVNNSITYTNSPGKIELTVTNNHNHITILISDSAPNIQESELTRIFEYLYRVENSRSRTTGGSGLGLSICNNIVQAHNGKITAKDSHLGGLTIVIELPLAYSS